MKIMLLEDDVSLNHTIRDILQTLQHCEVDSFYDGSTASDHINDMYDLYIIDINIPNINGMELLQFIKNSGLHSPVIIISSDTQIDTLSKAYKMGCNDFLKKPFHVEELLFKVKQYVDVMDILPLGPTLQYDVRSRKLYENDREVYLTKKEGDLLYLLISNKEDVVSPELIRNFVYQDQFMSNDSLRALIKRLRKIVGKETVINVPSQGYRINLSQ